MEQYKPCLKQTYTDRQMQKRYLYLQQQQQKKSLFLKRTSLCQTVTVLGNNSQGCLYCALGYGAFFVLWQGEQMGTLQVGESGFCSRYKLREERLQVGRLYLRTLQGSSNHSAQGDKWTCEGDTNQVHGSMLWSLPFCFLLLNTLPFP